jgi:hypothetical protein
MDKNKPNITVCDVHNPEWLINEIDKLLNESSTYRAIKVCLIEYNGQKYILILDLMNSSMCDGERFYTCGEESVACDSSLYRDLIDLYNKGNYILLWLN